MRPPPGGETTGKTRSPPCTTVALALARIRNEILIFLKIKDLMMMEALTWASPYNPPHDGP